MMPTKRNMIDVTLIGCNRRGLWYGAIFDDIDPNAYARMDPFHYHHMTFYSEVELQLARAGGFRLVKVFDPDAAAAERFAGAFRTQPRACKTLDEAVKNVDLVFIANESGDGSAHPRFAAAALRQGIPTFVDRPFAANVKDARAMIAAARRKRVPLLSCSHLRMLPRAAWFKARFTELVTGENLRQGMVEGRGPNPAHMADGIELALFLFGDEFGGRATSVQSMGAWPLELTHVTFSKPRSKRVLQTLVVNSSTGNERTAFWAKAVSGGWQLDSPDFDAFVQPEGGLAVMESLRKMVLTGIAPLPYPRMLEHVAIMEAGRRAHNRATAAAVKTVRSERRREGVQQHGEKRKSAIQTVVVGRRRPTYTHKVMLNENRVGRSPSTDAAFVGRSIPLSESHKRQ